MILMIWNKALPGDLWIDAVIALLRAELLPLSEDELTPRSHSETCEAWQVASS